MSFFFDLLKTRRSIRKYQPRKIDPETIKALTSAALMSPTSKHCNAWDFVAVENMEMLEKLSKCRPTGSQLLAKAPLAIVVTVNSEISTAWVEDGSIAALLIQLQAHNLGLGSCWVQVNGRLTEEGISTNDYIASLLNIPKANKIVCMVAIGYPDETKKAFEEENLQYEKVHYERYSQQ